MTKQQAGKPKLKDYLTWCPHCQQWQHHRAITLCWKCGREIPELREKWERRKEAKP